MKRSLRSIIAIVCAIAICAGLAAQYALDANTRVGSSGRNQRTAAARVSAPIYSVSRQTGEFTYNRANAFRDPSYSIYQSWGMTGSSYYGSQRGRNDNRAGAVLASGAGSTYATGAVRPVSRGIGRSSGVRRSSPGTGASSLRRHTYSAARPATTRVSSGRVGGGRTGSGRISNRAR